MTSKLPLSDRSQSADEERPAQWCGVRLRRRGFALLVLCATAGVVAWGAQRVQAHRAARAHELLAQATCLERQQQWLDAAEKLHRYSLLRPEDGPARVRLAVVAARGAQSDSQRRRALQLCEAALKAVPEAGELRGVFATLLLETGDVDRAVREAKQRLADVGDDPVAWRVLALGLAGDGERAGSEAERLEAFERAARDADHCDAVLLNAWLHWCQSGVEVASCSRRLREILDRQIAREGDDAKLYLLRNQLRSMSGEAGAESDLQQALLHRGEQPPAALWLCAGDAALRGRRWSDAERFYRQAVERPSASAEAYLGLGRSLSAQGETVRAWQVWRQGFETVRPASAALGFELAESLLASRQTRLAEPVLARLERLLKESRNRGANPLLIAQCERLYGEAAWQKHDVLAACERFQSALDIPAAGMPADVRAQLHAKLATLWSARRDDQQARRHLQRAIDLRPDWGAAHGQLGLSLAAAGEHRAATESLRHAVRLGVRQRRIYEALVGSLCEQSRAAEATLYLEQLGRRVPPARRLVRRVVAAELAGGDLQRAADWALREIERTPEDAEPRCWLAECLRRKGDGVGAEQVARSALSLDPRRLASWRLLLEALHGSEQFEATKQALEKLAAQNLPAMAERQLLLVEFYERLGQHQRADELLQQAWQRWPEDVHVLANIAVRRYLRQPRDAERALHDLVRQRPNDAAARRLLATLMLNHATGHRDEVLALLRPAEDAEMLDAANERLRALVMSRGEAAERSAARRLARQLVQSSGKPADHLLWARTLQADGLHEAAWEQLGLAAQDVRARPDHMAALVDAAIGRGQIQIAQTWLDRLAAYEPESISLRTLDLRLRLFARQGKSEQGTRLVEQYVQRQWRKKLTREEQAAVVVAAGRVASAAGLLELADQLAVRAETLADANPAVVAVWLAERKDIAAALEVCTRAYQQGNLAIGHSLAVAMVVGQPSPEQIAAAEPLFQAALEQQPENAETAYWIGTMWFLQNRYAPAEQLLRRALAVQPTHVAAANNLAMLLSSRADRCDEALQLVDRAFRTAGPRVELIDTRAWVLIRAGRAAEAAVALRRMLAEQSGNPQCHLHLALACHQLGDLREAETQLQAALASDLVTADLSEAERDALARLERALVEDERASRREAALR